MQIKIYFGNKPLYLASQSNPELEELLHHGDTIFIDEFNKPAVRTMIREMERDEISRGVLLHEDPQAVLKSLQEELELIQAAGGFVHTADGKLLLIFRRRHWDLPKGKLDEGEDLPTCAVREVQEETGLEKVEIESPLCVTYHTYHQDGKHILKESHWYLMKGDGSEKLQPQTDEDIEQCEWMPLSALQKALDNTHASIADVIKAGLERLGK